MGNYFDPNQQTQPVNTQQSTDFGGLDQILQQIIMQQLLQGISPQTQTQPQDGPPGGGPPDEGPTYDCTHPPPGGWPGGYNPQCPSDSQNCPPGQICINPPPAACEQSPNLEGCPQQPSPPAPTPPNPDPIDPTPDPGTPIPPPHPPPPDPQPPGGVQPGVPCPPGTRPGPIPGSCFPEAPRPNPTPTPPPMGGGGGNGFLFPWFWFGGDRFQTGPTMNAAGTSITPFHIPMPLENPQDFSGLNFDKWRLNMPDIPQLNLPIFGA